MLPLGLFRRRNFSAGNVETFAMYAGLAILFFFLVLFLQQIGGYTPLQSGLATLPVTLVMFLLSRRFGALADRYGPRLFMGVGPARGRRRAAAVPARRERRSDYVSDVLPPLLVFALGLSMTVAPLTAAVLAGAEGQAGIASGVNNAVARVAGLLGTAARRRGDRRSFVELARREPRRASRSARARGRRSAAAKRLPLGRPDVSGLPPGQARAMAAPPKQPPCTASTSAWRSPPRWSRSAGWSALRASATRARRRPGRGMRGRAAGRGQQPRVGAGGGGRPGPRGATASARLARVLAHRLDDRREPLGRARSAGTRRSAGSRGSPCAATRPAPSRSRRRSESIRGEIPETASANSLKRSAPVSAA